MAYIINTLIPIFSLILIGYFFKKISFPSKDFWPHADKFTYYILFPALLVYKLSIAQVKLDYSLIATAYISITIVFITLAFINIFVKFNAFSFTSTMQGAIRFNSYVLLAFVDSMYGDKGLVITAILMAFVIPYINVLCISTFAIYKRNGSFSFNSFFKTILTNPLILACIVGGFINYIGLYMPTSVLKTLSILSSASLPMGLLSIGVGLEFSHIKKAKLDIFVASFIKLIYFPLIAYMVASFFHLSGLSLSVAIIYAAMPTAVSGYILARQLGGDVVLMATIITVETVLSIATLFAIIPLL